MAKRFSDTNKWKKPFVRGLKGSYKLLWFYINDDCDHAGIWHVDQEVAELRVGGGIEWEKIPQIFGEKILIFDNGEKWFIPDFIEDQYGTLNEKNRVHLSVLDILKKYNLLEKIKGLISPLQGAKDKDKDKDKDKEGVIGETKSDPEIDFLPETDNPFVQESKQLPADFLLNEEEFAAAEETLKNHSFHSVLIKHHKITEEISLKWFRSFFELKTATGDLKGKEPMEVFKYFFNWIPSYKRSKKLNDDTEPETTGFVLGSKPRGAVNHAR
nr:hypothetical protein [Pedobacter sp. ASV19]